jgi:hypothetical protein
VLGAGSVCGAARPSAGVLCVAGGVGAVGLLGGVPGSF